MSHCFYLTCPNMKCGAIFCDDHKVKDFDAEYEIADAQVRRKRDHALVIVVGFLPLDEETRYDPDLVRSCLMGSNIEVYRSLPIAGIEYIPANSYYRITSDPMHGDESVEIFDSQEWLRS